MELISLIPQDASFKPLVAAFGYIIQSYEYSMSFEYIRKLPRYILRNFWKHRMKQRGGFIQTFPFLCPY